MSYFLSDNVSSVAWLPDYGVELGRTKNQDVFRTPRGNRYTYTWSQILIHKHTIHFVNSSNVALIAGWWQDDTPLVYTPDYDASDVSTVVLTGKRYPGSKLVKPYDDLYKVVITIEELP